MKELALRPNYTFFSVRVDYDGYDLSYVEPDDLFVVIGQHNQQAALNHCGKGKNACIFAAIGSTGVQCLRFGDMHESIQWRKDKMTAKREPYEPWPQCWAE